MKYFATIKIILSHSNHEGKQYFPHKAKQDKAWTYQQYYKLYDYNYIAYIYNIHTYINIFLERNTPECYHFHVVQKSVCFVFFFALNLFISFKFSVMNIFYKMEKVNNIKFFI